MNGDTLIVLILAAVGIGWVIDEYRLRNAKKRESEHIIKDPTVEDLSNMDAELLSGWLDNMDAARTRIATALEKAKKPKR